MNPPPPTKTSDSTNSDPYPSSTSLGGPHVPQPVNLPHLYTSVSASAYAAHPPPPPPPPHLLQSQPPPAQDAVTSAAMAAAREENWDRYQAQPPPPPRQHYHPFQQAYASPPTHQGYNPPHLPTPTPQYQYLAPSQEYQLHPAPLSNNTPRPPSRSQVQPSPTLSRLQPSTSRSQLQPLPAPSHHAPSPAPPVRAPPPPRQCVDVVHPHDVLSGRGVNISQHPGNERFRALVNARSDDEYCADYSTSEKRAVAREVIAHIHGLDPPGRFLKRLAGRGHPRASAKGLEGPWIELTMDEAVKKACQALRDCNRQDRSGYASSVPVPEDVKENSVRLTQSGLTLKEQAQQAAAKAKRDAEEAAERSGIAAMDPHVALSSASGASALPTTTGSDRIDAISPSIENAAQWLKKQRTDLDGSSAYTALSGDQTEPSDLMHAGITPSSSSVRPIDRRMDQQLGRNEVQEPMFDTSFFSAQPAVYSPHVAPPSADRDVSYPYVDRGVYSTAMAAHTFQVPPPAPSLASSFDPAHLHYHQHHQTHFGGDDSLEPLHLAATTMAAMAPPQHQHPYQPGEMSHHHEQEPLQRQSARGHEVQDPSVVELQVGDDGDVHRHRHRTVDVEIDLGGQDDSNDLRLSPVQFRSDEDHDEYNPRHNPFSDD